MSSPAWQRLQWAARQLEDCRLCPRLCRVNRRAGQTGWCGAGSDVRFFMEFVHYGEEAELVPSHAIYLTGCNLRCSFCHTAAERVARPSQSLTPAVLDALIVRGRGEGARNINLLGGEPSVNLPGLLRLFDQVDVVPPLVWNSNLYCSAEALVMLDGLAYNYLADLKAGNADCAEALTGAADYLDVVQARLLELHTRCPKRLIVRHLVLPGHVDCCTRPALQWLAQKMPRARVSLKLDYLVMPSARSDARLGRFLSEDEIRAAEEAARESGLSLVPQAVSSPGAGLAGAAEARPMDIELVISPAGKLFMRHPTREAMQFGMGLVEKPPQPEEKT